eukprot:gene9175-19009_t
MGSFPSSSRKAFEDRLPSACGQSRSFSVDIFVQIALNQIRREDSLKAIVENPLAISSFSLFLTSQILLCGFVFDFLVRDPNKTETYVRLVEIVSSTLQIVTAYESSLPDEEDNNSKFLQFACDSVIPFLRSSFFSEWRMMENLHLRVFMLEERYTGETTLPELQVANSYFNEECSVSATATICSITDSNLSPEVEIYISTSPDEFLSEPLALNINQYDKSIRQSNNNNISIDTSSSTLTEEAIASCDPVAIAGLLRTDTWLLSLLSDAETLPIGITISSVCNSRPGFPLVYVNKFFAMRSRYVREDLVGQSFGFMHVEGSVLTPQGLNSSRDISNALAARESIVTAFQSRRPSGKLFMSVVGVKPIIDQYSNYRYVIGVHIDLSIKEKIEHGISFVKALITSLPCEVDFDMA